MQSNSSIFRWLFHSGQQTERFFFENGGSWMFSARSMQNFVSLFGLARICTMCSNRKEIAHSDMICYLLLIMKNLFQFITVFSFMCRHARRCTGTNLSLSLFLKVHNPDYTMVHSHMGLCFEQMKLAKNWTAGYITTL